MPPECQQCGTSKQMLKSGGLACPKCEEHLIPEEERTKPKKERLTTLLGINMTPTMKGRIEAEAETDRAGSAANWARNVFEDEFKRRDELIQRAY